MKKMIVLFVGLLLSTVFTLSALYAAEQAPTVQLAADGKALLPIVISEKASASVKQAAGVLADYLGRISGANFSIVTGDGTSGIAVGKFTDFPALGFNNLFSDTDMTRREEYLLRTHPKGIYLVCASDWSKLYLEPDKRSTVAENMVWDLLYRLGYRQFFPGPKWEVIPSEPNISIAVDTVQKPSWYQRGIWYNWNMQEYNVQPYYDWCIRNRMVTSLNYSSGHVGELIYDHYKTLFDEHPEYLALVNGKRTGVYPKFCLSNPAVRQLFVDYSLLTLANNPDLDGVSVEPSDGGNWCECDNCKAMGVNSNRTVTVANEVAEAVAKKYGNSKIVGLQAYYEHAMPPTIKLHPNVVVNIAHGFLSGVTVEQLMAGWQKAGATIGVRDYYNVWDWSHDLPGNSSGANIKYLSYSIPGYHQLGARFMSSESGDNWGPNGLGYYLASRMLWDINEAKRIPELTDDFLTKCFGPAKEPMRKFYTTIDGSNPPRICTDLVGRLYRYLAEAKSLTDDPKINARLNDLILYMHYVELYLDYSQAATADRKATCEAFIRFTYRMRTTMMVHEYAIYHQVTRDGTIPPEAGLFIPEGENPWKSSKPFSEEEIRGILDAGIADNPANTWEATQYSGDLLPSGLPTTATATVGGGLTGASQFYIWADDNAALPVFKVAEGAQAGVSWTLYDKEGKQLETGTTAYEKLPATIAPATRGPGLFRLDVGSKYYALSWKRTPDTHVSLFMRPARFLYEWNGYFYVPKGTKVIAIYGLQTVQLTDQAGNPIKFTQKAQDEYTVIPVGPWQDGQLWHAGNLCGVFLSVETIPPYFAASPDDLLLPKELLEKDGMTGEIK